MFFYSWRQFVLHLRFLAAAEDVGLFHSNSISTIPYNLWISIEKLQTTFVTHARFYEVCVCVVKVYLVYSSPIVHWTERDGLILIQRHHHKIQIIEHFTDVLLPSNISFIGYLTMHFIIYRFNGGTLLCSRWLFEWICVTFYGSGASKFTWNFIYMAEFSRTTGKYNCNFLQ